LKKASLLSYLLHHRIGYTLAAVWSAAWALFFAGFSWYFRFEILGASEGSTELDRLLALPVSDNIPIARQAALWLLAPITALLVTGSLVLADTLLYLLHLDRDKVWFQAVRWSSGSWKNFLPWFLVFLIILVLTAYFDNDYADMGLFIAGLLMVLVLPFMVWNKEYVTAIKPTRLSMPQWPGLSPVGYGAIIVAVTMTLLLLMNEFVYVAPNPFLMFIQSCIEEIVFAIVALYLTKRWINRERKFLDKNTFYLKNIASFYALNLMLGLWTLAFLAPPIISGAVIMVFFMPSILNVYQHQSYETYLLLLKATHAANFITDYWPLLSVPITSWLLVHCYGRLVYLLGLMKDNADSNKHV
jgi:hypothetical protein